MTSQEAATHTYEIKKVCTSYGNIAIKNLQTENFISNKCLSLEHKLPYKGTGDKSTSFVIS